MLSAIVLVLLLLASLNVWGMVISRSVRGLPALEQLPRNPSPFLPLAASAAAVMVGLLLVFSLQEMLTTREPMPAPELSSVQAAAYSGILEIAIALFLLTGAGRVPLAECGLHWQHGRRQLRDATVGFAASVLPVLIVLLITNSLRTSENQHPYLKLLQEDRTLGTAVWLIVSAVVVAPIKEELLFRVMLQDGLARWFGGPIAIGLVSVMFCAVHGFPDSLALIPLAIILGYVYERRQSIVSVVVLHALFNLTNILLLLAESPEAQP